MPKYRFTESLMMDIRQLIPPPRLVALTTVLMVSPCVLNSCRTKEEPAEEENTVAPQVTILHENSLTENTSSFITSLTDSPVYWQAWDKNLFARATSERKTIFALIGSGTDPNSVAIMNRINQSASTCALLNDHHVNVLIDSNVHPDIEFFAAELCVKSRTPATRPILVWLSYEGNPISWSPINPRSSQDIDELITRMSNTVHQVWRDDPEYVLSNSRSDFKRRTEVLIPRLADDTPPEPTSKSVRRAASLFDPTSGSIDRIGNLSPSRYINLLIKASYHPDSSESQKKRYIKTASLASDHALIRGLIDPLDGGVYSGNQRSTIALPQFSKTLSAQAFAMDALYSVYQTTRDDRYLKAASAITEFTEKHLALPDGGYLTGILYALNSPQDNACIWTLEEIEAALTEEEAKICTIAFGLKGLGNIPLVDDPDRSYFRKNTLTWKVTLDELAQKTSIDTATLNQRLESITKKLAKLRTEKARSPIPENLSISGSTANYANACISGYRATGNKDLLKRAQTILTHLRKNFFDKSGNLHRARFNGKLQEHNATGSDYALIVRTALNLHEITLDPELLQFASDTHESMNLSLADKENHYVNEYDGGLYPQAYKQHFFYTLENLNNYSTWSLVYSNAKRLSLRLASDKLTAQVDSLGKTLFHTAASAPISSIDFLTEDTVLQRKTVYFKAPVSPELLLAASQSNCQIVSVTDKGVYTELGEAATKLDNGSATVTSQGKVIGSATSVAELAKLLK